MADLARTAIENEQKLQQQLILEDKDFVVDWVSANIRGKIVNSLQSFKTLLPV